MRSTYEEIEADWEKLVAREGRPLGPEAKAVLTAFWQYIAGLAVRARCSHCGQVLTVTDLGEYGQAWEVDCPCGRSKETLKGLGTGMTAAPGGP